MKLPIRLLVLALVCLLPAVGCDKVDSNANNGHGPDSGKEVNVPVKGGLKTGGKKLPSIPPAPPLEPPK